MVGIPTALGSLGGILYLHKHGMLTRITRRLACVGRMALTTYLLQSVIAGSIFYGWGRGLFGSVEMPVLVWILVRSWR